MHDDLAALPLSGPELCSEEVCALVDG